MCSRLRQPTLQLRPTAQGIAGWVPGSRPHQRRSHPPLRPAPGAADPRTEAAACARVEHECHTLYNKSKRHWQGDNCCAKRPVQRPFHQPYNEAARRHLLQLVTAGTEGFAGELIPGILALPVANWHAEPPNILLHAKNARSECSPGEGFGRLRSGSTDILCHLFLIAVILCILILPPVAVPGAGFSALASISLKQGQA